MTQRQEIKALREEVAGLRVQAAQLLAQLQAGAVHHHHHYPPAPQALPPWSPSVTPPFTIQVPNMWQSGQTSTPEHLGDVIAWNLRPEIPIGPPNEAVATGP